MKFPAKQTADFEICPAGNHVGICNAVIDLGMQRGTAMYPNPKRQVYIRFELPGERVKYQRDGKEVEGPMSIGTSMTASMSEKANLRKLIESWFGKKFKDDGAAADFDLQLLIGKRCLLNVTHTEKGQKTYANIANATPLPRGMTSTEPQHNPSLYFSLDAPDEKAFAALPEWLRKKIEARLPEEHTDADEAKREAQEGFYGMAAAEPEKEFSDDIPF